ncbi:MAG: hypothetical protein QM762_30465 [Chryseolinea sp.]
MTQFMASGVAPGDGKSFFQPVSLMRQSPPAKLELTLDVSGVSGVFAGLLLEGCSASFTKPVVFAGYGTATELDKIDVKGKIVLCLFGTEGSTSLSDGIFRAAPFKRKLVSERGAKRWSN